MDEIRRLGFWQFQLFGQMFAVFGGLAVVLAIVGVYGVLSYSVSQRTQEFGVRMALGANRRSVLQMVVGEGLILVGVGLALGMIASFAATRVLSTYLFDTTATDPLTFVAVAGAFVIAGVAACLGPAWRATTVDPMLALRAE